MSTDGGVLTAHQSTNTFETAVSDKPLFTSFGSRVVKPVRAPAFAYANLLFCHFIKQEEVTVSGGCK